MKDGIDWTKVGSGVRFEKIVSILLSTLHPDSERIDGSGGDGGRDHQLRADGRLDLWQSKYFLRRLSESSTRKGQITNSLDTAAALQPDSWTLVTPMVPNPAERAWFDELAANYPFPLVWRGGDWLDAHLAEHPAIVRYFMSANDEYVALLRELGQEQEALVDGLPAAVPRIERLAAKMNDSDPFYTVDFTVQDGQVVSAHLRSKYVGAERDSPIRMSFTMVAGPATAELDASLRSALDWGTAAVLPASYVRNVVIAGPPGFGGVHDRADITIDPAPLEPIDLGMRLVLQTSDGQHLAALPARLVARRAGIRGVTLHGRDTTGVVEARLRLVPDESRFMLALTATWSHPLLPGAALPILRFLQHATPPNTLSFSLGDTLTTTPVMVPVAMKVPEETVRLVENLERLQTAAGEPFPVPREGTLEDQREIRRAVQLLDGQRVKAGTESVKVGMTDLHRFVEALDQSLTRTVRISPSEPYIAHVAGHDLDLGPYTIEIPGAQLGAAAVVEGGHEVDLLPQPGSCIEIVLGGPLAGS